MSEYRELLIGCGHSREKRIHTTHTFSQMKEWQNLTTLDNNENCKPNIVFDLTWIGLPIEIMGVNVRTGKYFTLPDNNGPTSYFKLPDIDKEWMHESVIDEVHAYEVLEHLGSQGDFCAFFRLFAEFWRILKPNGYLCATVPHWQSVWAWGDPGHTRIINEGTLVFLDQAEYARQLGKTSMSDYRKELGDTNFKCVRAQTKGQTFEFVLQAVK